MIIIKFIHSTEYLHFRFSVFGWAVTFINIQAHSLQDTWGKFSLGTYICMRTDRSYQGSANYSPKRGLLQFSVNKMLLEHPCSFVYCLWLFLYYSGTVQYLWKRFLMCPQNICCLFLLQVYWLLGYNLFPRTPNLCKIFVLIYISTNVNQST